MKAAILTAVAVLGMTLIGCASTSVVVSSPTVTPITHRPEDQSVQRSVGLLRRLAVLPARIDFTPQDPKRCLDPCDWEQLRRGLVPNIVDYLSTSRGYEVVKIDPSASSNVAVDLTADDLQQRVARLAAFAKERSSEPPAEELAQIIRDLSMRAGVDGIVIVHGSATVLSWWDAAIILPLAASGYGFLAAIPVEVARLGTKLEADIFETATGRLVWTAVFTSGRANPPPASAIVTKLFDPIEPALPLVLTRPITAAR